MLVCTLAVAICVVRPDGGAQAPMRQLFRFGLPTRALSRIVRVTALQRRRLL